MGERYHCEFEMTYQEYKKMCWAIRQRKLAIFFLLICTITLLGGLFSLWIGRTGDGIFLLLFTLLYPILVYGLFQWAMHRNYYSQKVPADRICHYEFQEHSFLARTSVSSSEIPYTSLYRVVESGTNFYLMVGASQSFAIKKENCSEELLHFLHKIKSQKSLDKVS